MSRVALAVLAALALVSTSLLAQGFDAREAFGELDANRDGRISREEFEFDKIRVIFRGSRQRSAQLRFEDTQLTRATFDALDLDKDGVITVREVMEAPFFRFVNFDSNRDNFIDYDEFVALLRTIGR